MKESSRSTIPLPKAILTIFLSICIISGFSLVGILFYKHLKIKKYKDVNYTIVAVVQTSKDPVEFKTAYFAELLDLSIDRPQNLYSFNFKEAENKLLKAPVLKSVKVRKIFPGTVHIEYSKREPIAYFGDYNNTAIDKDGYVFPFKPFFTLKKLPEIITGYDLKMENSEDAIWGRRIKNSLVDLSFDVLSISHKFCDQKTFLKRIDVSRAFAKTIGEREIVLLIEDRVVKVKDNISTVCVYPRYLRLSPSNYREQLANYTKLSSYLRDKESKDSSIQMKEGFLELSPTVIDLRMTDLAFFHQLQVH